MKQIAMILAGLVAAGSALAAGVAPYPITVNSKADNAPALQVYRANERTIRVTYVDGTNKSATTGYTPFFTWATSNTASGIVTANYSVVSAPTGIVDFTFSPAQLNYAGGRYMYETGMKDSGGDVTVSRQGVFIITGSPTATGAGAVTFSTNLNWALYKYIGTPTYGPVRGDGSTITWTTNADGSITLVASGVAGVSWASVSAKPAIITDLVASNGSRIAILNAGSLTGVVANARLDADLQKLAGNDAGSLTNIPAANLAGTVANARLDADLQKLAGNDGGSLTNLNGSAIVSGTVPTERLAAALQTLAGNDGGNLTNLVESDTLQTVANRGAGATNELTLSGGVNMGGASITNVSTLGGSGVPNIIQLATSSSFDFQSSPVYGLGGANLAGATNLDHGTGLVGKGDDDHPQYVLASGSRAMGNLTVQTNATIGGTLSVTGKLTLGGGANGGGGVFTNMVQDHYLEIPYIATQATYNIVWLMPRKTAMTLVSAWNKTDTSTNTIVIVTATNGAPWNTCTTTNNTVLGAVDPTEDTTWASNNVPVGRHVGMKVLNKNSANTQGTLGLQVRY